jgi:hypothetical protein
MISKDEAKAMAEGRLQSLRETEEALSTGAATLEQLQGQGEQIDHARAAADLNEYQLALSRRMVRGMTWTGWMSNMVSSGPAPPPPPPRRPHANLPPHKSDLGCANSAERSHGQAAEEFQGWSSENTSVKAQLCAQDDYLDKQLSNVEQLGNMSQALGSSAASQTSQFSHLNDQVGDMRDETRAIVRMQGRLASSVRGKPQFRCFAAIEHLPSGRFLGVSENGDVELAPLSAGIPFGGRWEVYDRQDGVSGFKSLASRKWLGQTMLGHIKARGSKMGSWECWEVNVDKDQPILCCSANSHSGGWVHVSDSGTLVAKSALAEDKRAAPGWRFHPLGQRRSSN